MMESFLCEFLCEIFDGKINNVSVFYILSCWLSTQKGTIFAFVAPIIVIIIVGV